MEEAPIIHVHKNGFKHDTFRIIAFLLPSLVFASVIVFFLYKRYTPENSMKQVIAVEQEKRLITIGETQVTAAVAKTQWEQQKGLSGKADLGQSEGMYFPFSRPRTDVQFWMKDMLIDLDFIWVLKGKVVYIHTNVPKPERNTPDNKLPLVIPTNPQGVDGVIEVNAGFVETHGIKVDDPVLFQ